MIVDLLLICLWWYFQYPVCIFQYVNTIASSSILLPPCSFQCPLEFWNCELYLSLLNSIFRVGFNLSIIVQRVISPKDIYKGWWHKKVALYILQWARKNSLYFLPSGYTYYWSTYFASELNLKKLVLLFSEGMTMLIPFVLGLPTIQEAKVLQEGAVLLLITCSFENHYYQENIGVVF